MKVLKNHTLLFDQQCPLCNAYTSAFIRAGMLDRQGREPYHTFDPSAAKIDMDRARNEIALVNRSTGEVEYGTDGLVKILSARWPVTGKLYDLPPLKWISRRLYSFISYNRSTFAPCPAGAETCTPSFSFHWRWTFILLSLILCAFVLNRFAPLLPAYPGGSVLTELFICAGQLVFQAIFLAFGNDKRFTVYFGQVMTVSFLGAIPLFFLLPFSPGPHFALAVFGVVVAGMFLEHRRRVRLLNLPPFLTWTWVLYRVIILILLSWK